MLIVTEMWANSESDALLIFVQGIINYTDGSEVKVKKLQTLFFFFNKNIFSHLFFYRKYSNSTLGFL